MQDITYKLNPFWNCEIGMHEPVYDWTRKYTNGALNLIYNVHIKGAQNLPESGPALVLPKHQSYFDIPFMSEVIYEGCGRRMNTIMKKELLTHFGPVPTLGLTGWLWMRCGAIPINRENTRESIRELRLARSLVEQGELMVVYPEGTRCPGYVGPIDKDIIRFWQNARVKNLPFYVVGIEYVERDVNIHIGQAIMGQQIPTKQLTDIVQKEMSMLSNLQIKQ